MPEVITEKSDLSPEFLQALQLHSKGDLEAAAQIYRRLLESGPNARILTQLGLVWLQQQRLDEAAAAFDRAIELDANAADPYAWRGELLRQKGAFEAATAAFEEALRRRSDFAPAWFNLGLARADSGQGAAAKLAWLRFCELRPRDVRVRRELGVLAYSQGSYDEAISWFKKQLVVEPADATTRCDLAATWLRVQRWEAARESLAPLLAREPDHHRAQMLLGQVLLGERRGEEALDVFERAAARDPTSAEAAYQTGRALDRLARLESAIGWFDKAAVLAPHRADIRNALAVAQLNLAKPDRAISSFRDAIAIDPGFEEPYSALLMAMHYPARIDHAKLFDEHVRWAARHAKVAPTPRHKFANVRDPHRRLRVGYLSPRFCNPLAHFLLPPLIERDRHKHHVTCYSVSNEHDESTAILRAQADSWRDCELIPDDDLIAMVRDDEIDILVDLVGHCPGHRLGVFARRAAPVQISWLDYDDTTGVPAMDYYLTSDLHTPLDTLQRYTETVLRLPIVRSCYRPAPTLPDPQQPPALSRGYITFGCINRLSKLGDEVIETWAQILRRVDRSRMTLQATAFAAEETREVVRQRFARHGVDRERLDLRPFSDEASMLRQYLGIDVVLDPFPYNGCTTTCDALSMSVPVVTLEGTTLSGRHGIAILTACGMAHWVARSLDGYVDLACNVARDYNLLRQVRAELRERFLASPLCDASRFARTLEELYRRTWIDWCLLSGDQGLQITR